MLLSKFTAYQLLSFCWFICVIVHYLFHITFLIMIFFNMQFHTEMILSNKYEFFFMEKKCVKCEK